MLVATLIGCQLQVPVWIYLRYVSLSQLFVQALIGYMYTSCQDIRTRKCCGKSCYKRSIQELASIYRDPERTFFHVQDGVCVDRLESPSISFQLQKCLGAVACPCLVLSDPYWCLELHHKLPTDWNVVTLKDILHTNKAKITEGPVMRLENG